MSSRPPYFDTPYHPLRPFLLSRAVYLLLAGDLWFGMVQHGGRYGLGGFNVAHFALLDFLVPLPSPRLYVGLLLFSGVVSLSLGLFSQPRWLRMSLAASYSTAWMISIHDSYQHHYFISWLLVWCSALPEVPLRALSRSQAGDERVRGWGLPMACITCAIVYGFTGVAKSEAAWRRGDVLRALARAGEQDMDWGALAALREPLRTLGLSETALWGGFAYATIALQWLIAIAYLFAIRRDLAPSRWRTVLLSGGLLGAVCFHVSAELFGHFEIGVFSYYMLVLALVLLAPLALLRPLANGLAALPWERMAGALSGSESWWRLSVLIVLVAATGYFSALPGAFAASLALAILVTGRLMRARTVEPRSTRLLAIQTAVSALMLWLALYESSMVFDFYRRTAGELRRMGRVEEALAAYRMADQHAPSGQSRAHEIRELEAELHRSRP
jgi:Vitamin K-dependent gamma-carboxylase